MDEATRRIYESNAQAWIEGRRAVYAESGRLGRFAKRLGPSARVADLGSGPGWYAAELARLGARPLAMDCSLGMLTAPGSGAEFARVAGDLARPPFKTRSLDAALGINAYSHLTLDELPQALAHLHQCLVVGAPVEITLRRLDALPEPHASFPGDELEWRNDGAFPGRLFTALRQERSRELLESAGFEAIQIDAIKNWLVLSASRADTLPDYIRPRLRGLFIGLNPSLYAAETGIPFGRPGNRFWPALQEADLFGERDPFAALTAGFGFTDLVKRPTRRASELSAAEFQAGLERAAALVLRYKPRVVVFVGLDGWRRAADSRAQAGPVAAGFSGRPLYLMPSTSGLNASTQLEGFVEHLRRAFG